jgi:hypothetical protein
VKRFKKRRTKKSQNFNTGCISQRKNFFGLDVDSKELKKLAIIFDPARFLKTVSL